ncbi:hypothetical protein CLAFUW4_00233 [Fulvia fulva]|uniref:uncharacterized protein n=1 Tax=Passalora fulva TaxID=5499 RepID=UPI0004EA04CD|nr:uncharacterized protein CLAFUR5_20118 [Fulvia fulva]KAK4634948.1 hypothetical protein CLAFUR4_00233 [Fulvia fulva]KAK4638267.1 hypothetical protein CLAFUR0_00234 [Fulvia fulva]WMI38744.1 hypothetical protein CLAFUR5_20118 [Fulvia fulva]WPV09606.1 hypothetical protein CLAFUW4_00233 [Fulvia fulva]WPV23802.1 hypothetical protein CLAFUW7_00237 [Fulvia fulva]
MSSNDQPRYETTQQPTPYTQHPTQHESTDSTSSVTEVYYSVLGLLISDALANSPAAHEFADEFVTQKKALSDTTLGQRFHADISAKLSSSSAAPAGTQQMLESMNLTVDDIVKPKEEEDVVVPKPIEIIAFRKVEPGDNKPLFPFPPGIPLPEGKYIPIGIIGASGRCSVM